jgi:DNA-binding MarR family transcriptional regulator
MRDEDVYRLQKQLKRLYRRVQRELPAGEGGPSYSAQQVLVAVERAGRALRPGELAAELQMATSNVAATLRSLEADGLVVRRPDPEDGRKALVSLTAGGAKLITEARRGKHAWLQQAMSEALTPEERQLLLRAGDLMQRLAGYQGPVSGPARE